jgi:hypothetical protein
MNRPRGWIPSQSNDFMGKNLDDLPTQFRNGAQFRNGKERVRGESPQAL